MNAHCGMAKATYVATPGWMPTMVSGDILGHESMGEVVEVGKAHSKFKVGDRVVVPFNLACGECFFCKKQLYSLATGRTAMRKRQSRPWASPRWVCSVILTCVAAKLWASRISSRPYAMSGRSKCRTKFATSTPCSSRTSLRQAMWPPRTPESRTATPSPSGAAAQSANSPSRVREMARTHGRAETLDFQRGKDLQCADGDDGRARSRP